MCHEVFAAYVDAQVVVLEIGALLSQVSQADRFGGNYLRDLRVASSFGQQAP